MEDMNHTDRSRRLQIAMDPSTSLAALLELAMEFPEAVAANPALPVALAADPAAVESAEAVAIVCLITSPDLPATVGAALEGIFARTYDEDEHAMLGDYLEEWRRLGSRRVSINHAQPAVCAQGPEVSIERLLRGQALLAKRLGWQKCEGRMNDYGDYEPTVTYVSADGVEHDSEDAQFRILWPHWSSNPDSECEWSVDFTKGPTALVTLTEDD